jgi:folate-binding protein YgfZ
MLHALELHWLRTSVGVLNLDDRALISVAGDDAFDWLQGQVTNQCEGAKAGDSVYAFILTLKGRVLADVWALYHADGIWLDVPASQVDAVMERLDRYIIMEDVDLERRDDRRVVTAQGPKAGELADASWPSDRLGVGGRVWLVPEPQLDEEIERISRAAEALGGGWVSPDAWRYAQVTWGRPKFGVDFGEWTYPQESGLTPIAVSFHKGCYIGQETVVMLENRGKAPKVLWRWSIDTDEIPAAKTPIMRGGESVGELTSAVRVDGSVEALGFLKRGHGGEREGFEVNGSPAQPRGPVAEHLGVPPLSS